MRKVLSVLGSAIFLVIAPGFIAGLVPRWIYRSAEPATWLVPVRAFGALLIAAGAGVLLECFGRFALKGLGTPAPIFPTRHLVVTGLYRYVRNPMYVAVLSLIFGQGLLLGIPAILEYGAFIWLAFHLFVLAYEEPTLLSAYGEEYACFCANVPRWIPRLSPWRQFP
jgi:protein-S-isoprenylcysteine O-methyltransferase Ste14